MKEVYGVVELRGVGCRQAIGKEVVLRDVGLVKAGFQPKTEVPAVAVFLVCQVKMVFGYGRAVSAQQVFFHIAVVGIFFGEVVKKVAAEREGVNALFQVMPVGGACCVEELFALGYVADVVEQGRRGLGI